MKGLHNIPMEMKKELSRSGSTLIPRDFGKRGSEFTFLHPPPAVISNKHLFLALVGLAFATAISLSSEGNTSIIASVVLGLTFLIVSLTVYLYFKVSSEKIVMLSSLGVQIETEFALGNKTSSFIDISYIDDIVINEAISMHSINYYLIIIKKSRDNLQQLIPLFTRSRIPLADLKKIYRAARVIL